MVLGSEIQQIPGVHHRKIGDIVVTALSDGHLDLPLGIVRNLDSEKARQLLKEFFRPSLRISVNAFLIRSKNRCPLVDTGSGDYLQKSAGGLANSLLAAGVDSATIDTVLLTHMHPDHSAGLTHMPSGTRNFPNAELVLHAKELRRWFDDAAISKADEQTRSLNFRAGREQVAPYAKQTHLFEQGEVFPGVTAIPSPGHTPGHTAYLVASRTDQLLIRGTPCTFPNYRLRFLTPPSYSIQIERSQRSLASNFLIVLRATTSLSRECTCISHRSVASRIETTEVIAFFLKQGHKMFDPRVTFCSAKSHLASLSDHAASEKALTCSLWQFELA